MSLLTRLAARILSKRARQSAHDRILATTRLMREQCGLPADGRLA